MSTPSKYTVGTWKVRGHTIVCRLPKGAVTHVLSDKDALPEDLDRAAKCVTLCEPLGEDPAAKLAEVRAAIAGIVRSFDSIGRDGVFTQEAKALRSALAKLGKANA